MASCYNCGNIFPDDYKVFRTTECSSCGRDVRVCKNCRFYSPGSHWDCRETVPEAVSDKEKANFCGYFSLKQDAAGTEAGEKSKESDALDAFNDLFN